MAKPKSRTYSRYTHEAIRILSGLIRTARLDRKMTTTEVAERAGISRGLLTRIEKGDLKCEIGAYFEVAAIVGVSLFDAEPSRLEMHRRNVEDVLSLMPRSVRRQKNGVDDDF